ncbi:MAG: fumarate hydratase, partial [Planctomycetota bacterium]|nr:fumarate hydratase [Planctomycetota bacterium]
MAAFEYHPIVQRGPDTTEYRSLTSDHVTVEGDVLRVEPAALELLAFHAFDDITHLLRSDHLAQLRKILDDPEASDNDRFVALELLKNAN